MKTNPSHLSIRVYLCSSAVLILLISGCAGKPSAANIELRKQNQDLHDQLTKLQSDRQADLASITALEQSKGTIPTLPYDRLEKLFTTHGLRIGMLSGGVKLNRDAKADDALKVYVVPIDGDGDVLKSAGSFVVEAYDLDAPDSPLVGKWDFTADQSRQSWLAGGLLYEFVLTCPLSATPAHNRLTIHVSFTDELTGRKFEAQKIVNVSRT